MTQEKEHALWRKRFNEIVADSVAYRVILENIEKLEEE